MKMFEVDEKTRQQEADRPKFTLHSLHNMYDGVKIPWGKYIIATILGVVFFFISGSVASVTSKVAAGDFSDSAAIIKYVLISILALGTVAAGYMLDHTNYTLNTREKYKLWKKILKLPSEYFDKESPNRMISRVTTDSDAAIVPFTLVLIILVLVAMVLGVVTTSGGIFAMPMSKWLIIGLILMLFFVIAALIVLVTVGFVSANRLAAFTSFLSERLADFKLIKASCAEEKEKEAAHQLIENRYKAELLGTVAQVLNYLSANVVILFTYIGCYLLGWGYYSSGQIPGGQEIVRFAAYGASIGSLMAIMATVVSAFGSGAGQAAKFAAIYDEKEEDLTSGSAMPEEPQEIALEHVDFSYDGSRKVLKDISLTIPKGSVTALVGSNGSGKSTLIKVIDRLYEDRDGVMKIGEADASDINLASWRDRIGIVSQNASLFSGSIRSNICYGTEGVSEEEIAKVCRMAGLDEVIAGKPEGLDYEVGIGGCRLSGGEQQRVAIARAMIKDPDYLILDEATANLDTKTAKQVEKSIDELMKGRTVITIAHSYEMIKKADQIIVLTDGEIVDHGTHEELLARNGFYQQLAQAGFEN